jgi:hypothetical protein
MVIPAGMGDCCQVMVLVISHRPGLLRDCARASMVIANRQKPRVIK